MLRVKSIATPHPWPAAEWHEPQGWICLGLKPPILLETVTCTCTYRQPWLSLTTCLTWSVGFSGKKFFGQSRKVVLSCTLFYWKVCSDLIHWFRLMYQAIRSRNKEMSDTLKGQLIRKGVASLAIHRIKMQSQNCGMSHGHSWDPGQLTVIEPGPRCAIIQEASESNRHLNCILCLPRPAISSAPRYASVLQLGFSAPRLHLQRHVPFHFYSPALWEHLWLRGNWAHNFQKKH